MRLVELARVTDAQRNLVGIGWGEFKVEEGLLIKNSKYNFKLIRISTRAQFAISSCPLKKSVFPKNLRKNSFSKNSERRGEE